MLTKGEILRLMNDYIGVEGGYLGDFSARTLGEFYPIYCGIEINLNAFTGTTNRYLFQDIAEKSDAKTQAKIIRGVFKKYPIESFEEVSQPLKRKMFEEYLTIIERLESDDKNLSSEELEAHFEKIQSQIIDEINKAEHLIWVAVAWFTDKKIFSRLATRQYEGLNVEIILCDDDKNKKSGLEYNKYLTTFWADSSDINGLMHNKFCIIDWLCCMNPSRF